MTYRELLYKATRLINNNKITIGEYEEMTKPLDREVEQEPVQVELEGDGYAYGTDEMVYDSGKCPNCGWLFVNGDKDWEEPFCCHCGQKLKWFDSKAESEG